jgi:hypothetical protein
MRARGKGGTQAGLRVLGDIRSNLLGNRTAAALFIFLESTDAFAEVCDKTWGVPETYYDPSYEPVYRGFVLSPFATVSLVIILAIIVWRFKLSQVSWLLAAISLV